MLFESKPGYAVKLSKLVRFNSFGFYQTDDEGLQQELIKLNSVKLVEGDLELAPSGDAVEKKDETIELTEEEKEAKAKEDSEEAEKAKAKEDEKAAKAAAAEEKKAFAHLKKAYKEKFGTKPLDSLTYEELKVEFEKEVPTE